MISIESFVGRVTRRFPHKHFPHMLHLSGGEEILVAEKSFNGLVQNFIIDKQLDKFLQGNISSPYRREGEILVINPA